MRKTLAVLALTAACAAQPAGVQVAATTVSSKVLLQEDRSVTPSLRGADLEGRPFDVAGLRGKLVVVNYWGSWCAPCRKETPDLVRAAGRAAPLGVAFAGVNIRDNKDSARAFARELGVPYPSLFDPGMASALGFGAMAPRALPATYVLDRQGRVAAFFFGAVTEPSLMAVLRGLAGDAR
ncbi:TlpA family protein disulfide reductase [Nonomuraea sediminis]|uniref:TlpA family protein disulfide reductase n=1 Tax=Nonomuraea sediminis TaxID=2835864 RepID=UPI001BDC0ABC|nr:TlpA disulfide reductase family protein [Nonomuraea sediminis]